MNYCEKIRAITFTLLKADFEEMVDKLLAQLPQNEQIFRLAFSACRMIMNNMFRAA